MMMQDKLEKERNDAKNAVEEYVYDFRDKLCGVFEKFITEEVRLTSVFQLLENDFSDKSFEWYLWKLQESVELISECEMNWLQKWS